MERVPATARKSFIAMFAIMLGFTFFSASMWTGVSLANGLDLSGFFAAVLIGGAILAAYTGTLGYIGSQTGLSFDLLAQRSFGKVGSYLPSAMISLTQIGWFGVGAAMFAIPAAGVIAPDSTVLPYVFIFLAGACMTFSAYFGIKGLEIVSYISVPLIAVLGIYSMVSATIDGGGLSSIFAKSTGGLTLFTGIGMVVGSFVSGGTATPNFVRFAKSNKSAVISTVIAFFIGNTLMFCFGGVAGAYTGENDIFYVMIAQGLGVLAFIVLGANIWTTNDNALYASGLGFANITGLKSKPLSVINGLIGTACALWLYNNFVGWLAFLSTAIPPIGGIIIMDFLLNRERYRQFADQQFETVRWQALVATAVGVAVGKWLPGIVPLNAVLGAAFIYFILVRLTQRPVLVQEASKC